MKFSAALFALFAIQGASAYTANSPPMRPSFNQATTSLSASSGTPPFEIEQTRRNAPPPAAMSGAAPGASMAPVGGASKYTKDFMRTLRPVKVQGSTLKTCSFNESVERVQVFLETGGRPLNAEVDLWQGPDNAPQKMRVYLEDGFERPFSAVVETPGAGNAIAVRNTAPMEFPLNAYVEADNGGPGPARALASNTKPRTVQGGAVYTTPFAPNVKSVQIMLDTDGRPLNARIELLQGPNNNKQVMEVYCEDGLDRPFFVVVETPGDGNVVRIVNTATLEYPLSAHVEAYQIDNNRDIAQRGAGIMWS
uniref:Uncharacterized protein n=1 Tax=Helicotheca tamesis TaxID=374047 RepID=A0A7S2MLH3_9STRA|mmetsp:Transcript_17946/g.24706  ORF Transcript_17946/g.24706 Transcript_17946/m.24706 type:complete len:308 (+) Transcript_17946:91-1014(+)|eukprot:CAMPEP_0185729110 /NCGR_PEP_ID=MMETSP1171-20130828/4473_1 /TAXON_ID=374046 /ORGANISM="Helicotheca tamensis, Strain CCMP826" /LENGTH=307 /DNA_ID=CAMNT_0028397887 /DNA_START=72 /DNA_END=995 /DNA_ORIENTATION=+